MHPFAQPADPTAAAARTTARHASVCTPPLPVRPQPSMTVHCQAECRPVCNAPAWGAMSALVQHACMPVELGTKKQARSGSWRTGLRACHIVSCCGGPDPALHAFPRRPDFPAGRLQGATTAGTMTTTQNAASATTPHPPPHPRRRPRPKVPCHAAS